jgi:hypothetical protein
MSAVIEAKRGVRPAVSSTTKLGCNPREELIDKAGPAHHSAGPEQSTGELSSTQQRLLLLLFPIDVAVVAF